jgi:hypothetical protein
MTDDQLIEQLERGTLPPRSFGHREHLRVAWCYLTWFGRHEAERRLLAGLRAFAARAGKPDKFDAALTTAWMTVLADAKAALGPGATFDTLAATRPDLLDPASVRALR